MPRDLRRPEHGSPARLLAGALALAATLAGCGQTSQQPTRDPSSPVTPARTSSRPAGSAKATPGAIPTHSVSPTARPTHPAAATSLRYGPGPVSPYTVQAQPTPGSCHYRYTAQGQPLPDPRCTPGALNPKVTSATLSTTICRSGYTRSIRPPRAITSREKSLNAASYGYTGHLGDAEYDHLVPLELGGDPNSAANLWVEPPSPGHRPGSGVQNPKDDIENRARALVCDGLVPLPRMQQAIAVNWTTALSTVGF